MSSNEGETDRLRSEADASSEASVANVSGQIDDTSSGNGRLRSELSPESYSLDRQLEASIVDNQAEIHELRQRLQAMEGEQRAEVEKLRAAYEEEKSTMIRNYEDQLKRKDGQLLNPQETANDEILRELKDTKEELEGLKANLVAAEKKAAQALQVANKIKKAASAKLQSLTDQHANAIADAENSNAAKLSTLQSELELLRSREKQATQQIEQLQLSLEQANNERAAITKDFDSKKQVASFGLVEKMKLLAEKHTSSTTQFNDEKANAAKCLTLQSELDSSKKEIEQLQSILAHTKDERVTLITDLEASRHAATSLEKKLIQLAEERASLAKQLDDEKSNDVQFSTLQSELESSKEEIQQLRASLVQANDERETLVRDLDDAKQAASSCLEEKLNQLAEENASLTRQLNDEKLNMVQLSTLQSELDSSKKEIEQLQSSLAQANEERETLVRDLEDANQAAYASLEEKLNKLAEENASLTKQLNDERANTDKLSTLQSELDSAKIEIQQLQSSLGKANDEHDTLVRDLEDAKQAAYASLEEKLNKLAEENASLTKQLNDERANDDKLSTLQSELDSSKKEIEQLQASLAEAIDERETLVRDLEDAKQAASSCLEEKLNKLAEENASLTKPLIDERANADKLSTLQSELDSSKKEIQQLQASLVQAMSERETLVRDLEDANQAASSCLEEKLNQLAEENASLTKQLIDERANDDKLSTLQSELDSSKKEIEQLQASLAEAERLALTKDIHDGNQAAYASLEEKLNQLAEENASLSKQLKVERANTFKLSTLQSELETSKIEIQQLQASLAEAIGERETLVRDLEDSNQAASSCLEEKLNQLAEENASLTKQLNDERANDDKLSTLQSELDSSKKEIEQLQASLAQANNERETLVRDLEDSNQAASASLEEKLNQLAEENSSLSKQLNDEKAHAVKLSTLQSELDSSKKEIEQLQASLAEANDERVALTKDLHHASQAASSFEEKLNQLAEENATIKKQLNEEKANTVKLSTLQSELDSSLLSLEYSKNEMEQLQLSYNEANSDRVALMKDLEAKQAALSGLDEKMKQLVEENSSLATQLNEHQANAVELAALQCEVDSFRSNAEDSKREIRQLQSSLDQASNERVALMKDLEDVKRAAAEELKHLAEKNMSLSLQLNEEKSNGVKLATLQSELDSLRSSADNSKQEICQLQVSLDQANKEKTAILKSYADAKQTAERNMKQLAEKHASSLMQINQDHDQAMAKTCEVHKQVIAKLQADHDSQIAEQGKANDRNRAKLQQMMANHADDLKDHYENKFKAMKEEHSATLQRVRDETTDLKAQIHHLTEELNARKSDVDRLTTELSNSTNAALVSTNAMLEEQAKLQIQIKELLSEKNKISNQNEELSGKLKALSGNMVALTEDNKDLEEQLERSTKLVNKYKNAESELNSLRQENNALKLEQMKTSGILAKLNQERDDNERKHGQRTALVGMLEEQVADLNDSLSETKAKLEATAYDIQQKDQEIESLRRDLEKAESSLKVAENKAAESVAAAQQNTEKDSIQKSRTIKSLQAQVENLQSQMKKKSAAAQKILKEREAECIELRKTNKFLQNEVDKGSLSDRRIFELAAQQSNRETAAVAEIEIRDRLVARLTKKLEQYDGDLASAEISIVRAEDHVESLARVHRREGVNMDYLKSIVVQYLAKPPGSSERAALLPVLATLLQFDESDYKAIEEGKQKVSWWGDIIPTYITGPDAPSPAPLRSSLDLQPTSAEVAISSTSSNNSSKKTSLQF